MKQFHKDFYGVGDGELVISGQFDPVAMQKLVTDLFGGWKSPAHYERLRYDYAPVAAINDKIETPDKQNAEFLFDMAMKMNDADPDYPALIIAGSVFGGSSNSRLFQRIRVKDGYSYGVSGGFGIRPKDDASSFSGSAIAAPQNMAKVEADFKDELARALKDGFSADEVEKAKKTWLDERALQRSEETSVATLLQARERWARTLDWDAKLEAAVAALTPQQVNDAFRRHVAAGDISIVKAGDFKKAGVYQ